MAVASAALSASATSAIYQSSWPSGTHSHVRALKKEAEATRPLPAEALFAELSVAEIRAVAGFAAGRLGCNRTYVNLSMCFLTGAEAVRLKLPRKDTALAHLDNDAAAPRRMAQVMVAHGDKPVEEGLGIYAVGPLDGKGGLAEDADVTLVESLHWNYRPLQMDDASVDPAVTRALEPIRDLLLSSFGPIFPNLKDSFDPKSGIAVYWTGANLFSRLEQRSSRFWFNWFKDPSEFQVSWLHTLPFNFDMAHEGPPEQWSAVNISYCGQLFPTIEALAKSEANGDVRHCNGTQHTEYSWDVPGPDPGRIKQRFLDSFPANAGDVLTQTWKVTPGGSITWGDWQLLATIRPSSGLALHDVRYRGERILYELSLSDCHAYYAGPSSGKQYHFSDKAYSMTQISGDMVEGLDCPAGASFLTGALWVPFFRNGTSKSDPSNAHPVKLFCVFESNGFEGSSWRHTQLINREASGRPKRSLVVRAIGTVGNYDYITEVRFGEDGSVNVRESFAGYPEVDWHFESMSPNWGAVVQSEDEKRGRLVQNLHSHYCVFKVDLDVLGTANEFHATSITHEAHPSAGMPPQKMLETSRVEREDPSSEFVATAQKPGVWRIVNPEARNKRSGELRGYAVVVGSAPSVQSFNASHPFALASTFARRHLAVTQRKEEEPEATSVLDFYAVTDPHYSVDHFLSDRESLVGEDLVCWVSIGKEHPARAEDQPLISNMGVEFSLVPWDYHEENPEMVLAMKGKGPENLLSSSELRQR